MTQASSPLPPLISSPPPTIPPTTETINSPTWSSDLSSEDGSSHFDLPSDLEWSDTDHHLIDPIQRAQLLSDIRELGHHHIFHQIVFVFQITDIGYIHFLNKVPVDFCKSLSLYHSVRFWITLDSVWYDLLLFLFFGGFFFPFL